LTEILNKKKVLPLGEEYRREQAKIKSAEVFQFIKHLVGCIAHPAPSLKAFLVSPANIAKFSAERRKKIIHLLEFDEIAVAEELSRELQKWVPGRVSLDETILAWKCDHPAVIHLERRPEPYGVKCINISFRQESTAKY
jgi:hypothetical protein